MTATLYVIPGSHACRSAMLMLEHEGVEYRTVVLPTGMHPAIVRARGFPGHRSPIREVDGRAHSQLALLDRLGTVPALRMAGERIQTNRAIARFLDREPGGQPLFPSDPEHRSAVEEAERWGDEVLQMAARRVVLATALHGLDAVRGRAAEGRLGPLLARSDAARIVMNAMASRSFKASRSNEAELVASTTPMFDRVDAWIAEGVLGGEQLYVADFMIAPSLALLAYRPDLDEQLAARPAGAFLDRLLPEPAASA